MGEAPGLTLLLSTLAVTLGVFAASSPARAAQIWGWNHLDRLAPEQRDLYLRWYRVFGVVLCIGGVLFALDRMVFSHY
jgi:hypothetical protein